MTKNVLGGKNHVPIFVEDFIALIVSRFSGSHIVEPCCCLLI